MEIKSRSELDRPAADCRCVPRTRAGAGRMNIETHTDLLAHLKRIEAILRNGLPTDDKVEASTITQAHSEIEKLLESIYEDWWMK
jgi:hypothetical protein